MPAFILRYAGTKSLAGFYAADTENKLFDLIDEETDPGDYEYLIIPGGFGIEFRKGVETLDLTIGEVEEPGKTLAGADYVYLTSELDAALGGDEALEWRRLYQDL